MYEYIWHKSSLSRFFLIIEDIDENSSKKKNWNRKIFLIIALNKKEENQFNKRLKLLLNSRRSPTAVSGSQESEARFESRQWRSCRQGWSCQRQAKVPAGRGIRPDLQRNPISHRSDFGPLHGTRYTGLTGRSGSIFKTKKWEFKFCYVRWAKTEM